MTREEWKVFSDELFTAFPGFFQHVQKSHNVKGTLETWFNTLLDVSIKEARSVVKEWQSGSKEPPRGFELDYVAIVIKSRVGGVRSKESGYKVARSLYEEKQRVLEQRKAYRPIGCDMVAALDLALKLAPKVDSGEITNEQYRKMLLEAVA
jgi:hypothetical protein